MVFMDLSWDCSTKYDFFISLSVLLNPERFNVRATWAAGVRSRIPSEERRIIKTLHTHLHLPSIWCYKTSVPSQSGEALLQILQSIPDDQILNLLFLQTPQEQGIRKLLEEITLRGSWQEENAQELRQAFEHNLIYNKPAEIKALMNLYCTPGETGRLYKKALAFYYHTFFKEEEERILPYLEKSMQEGRILAETQPLQQLIESLCNGLTLQLEPSIQELVCSPSYWITPLISYDHLTADKSMLLYGCRPINETVVPGENLSPHMMQSIKALADPTRLKIIKLLQQAPLTPKAISELLRLRPPTVIHHLQILRSCGLVHLMLNESDERLYNIKSEVLKEILQELGDFLSPSP